MLTDIRGAGWREDCPRCVGSKFVCDTHRTPVADWQPVANAPLNIEVMTKIDDGDGCRNEQSLVMKQRTPETRPMWWAPDGSMYVYYTPTHWKPLAATLARAEVQA